MYSSSFSKVNLWSIFVGKGGGGRRSSGCSTDSWSSYDSLDEDDENLPHPRERPQVNSQGFSEFCVRNIERHELGRREIDLAEMEMTGILAFRQKATPDKPLKGNNLNRIPVRILDQVLKNASKHSKNFLEGRENI